jgi:hypothetical protein
VLSPRCWKCKCRKQLLQVYPQTKYRGLILSNKYRLSLLPLLSHLQVVSWVGYVNRTNQPTGSGNWKLSDMALTLQKQHCSCTCSEGIWGL